MKDCTRNKHDITSMDRSDDDILLGSADSTTVKYIGCNKPKHPCDPEPKCPTTPCDPSTVKLQCCSKGVFFKLSCSKLPPDCDHPEARYECDVVDEGVYIDPKILSACDLKCERIEAIHNDHSIMIEDDTKVTQVQNVSNMVCSKDCVNCSVKCTMTPPDPNQSTDVRFLCEIQEKGSKRRVSSDKLQGISLKYTEMCNTMDDSILGDTDAKDYFTIHNINNPLLSNTGKGQEKNVENLIDNDDNDERLFVPTSSSPLVYHEMSDLLENNKVIYACRSKPKLDEVENKYMDYSNESVKFDCITKDKPKSCEKQSFASNSENIELYACPKSNREPEQDDLECTEEPFVDQLTSSFVKHHNETVKIIKVAANDLICLISKSSKDTCKNNKADDLNCINALIDFTKDTINAVVAHTNKWIGSDKECDNEPKISNARPHKTFELTSPKDLIKSTNDDIDNIDNQNAPDDHVKLQNDNNLAQDNLAVKTANFIKEPSQDIYTKVCKTAPKISEQPLTVNVFTSLTDEDRNKVPEDVSENSSTFTPLSPQEIAFKSDEYGYESDKSAPQSNIFVALRNKIHAMLYEDDSTDYCTRASSSSSDFSEDSDDNHMPKPVH